MCPPHAHVHPLLSVCLNVLFPVALPGCGPQGGHAVHGPWNPSRLTTGANANANEELGQAPRPTALEALSPARGRNATNVSIPARYQARLIRPSRQLALLVAGLPSSAMRALGGRQGNFSQNSASDTRSPAASANLQVCQVPKQEAEDSFSCAAGKARPEENQNQAIAHA
ncbi:hypothetical protein ACJZ2D_000156 [Fusarium nematophilum]